VRKVLEQKSISESWLNKSAIPGHLRLDPANASKPRRRAGCVTGMSTARIVPLASVAGL
jgi:hypothetical protein